MNFFNSSILRPSEGCVLRNSGGFLATFANTLLTVNRTFTLPDVSGTVALINGGQTFTSATWNATAIGATGKPDRNGDSGAVARGRRGCDSGGCLRAATASGSAGGCAARLP